MSNHGNDTACAASDAEGLSPRSTTDPVAEAEHYAAARRSPSSLGVAVESSDQGLAVTAGSSVPTTAKTSVDCRQDQLDSHALSSALRNASQSHGMPLLDFKLPWETGGMNLIFGVDTLLPKLEARALIPMPSSLEAAESMWPGLPRGSKLHMWTDFFLKPSTFLSRSRLCRRRFGPGTGPLKGVL